jgi:hypothetical protein
MQWWWYHQIQRLAMMMLVLVVAVVVVQKILHMQQIATREVPALAYTIVAQNEIWLVYGSNRKTQLQDLQQADYNHLEPILKE